MSFDALFRSRLRKRERKLMRSEASPRMAEIMRAYIAQEHDKALAAEAAVALARIERVKAREAVVEARRQARHQVAMAEEKALRDRLRRREQREAKIIEMIAAGVTQNQVALRFRMSRSWVCAILKQERTKEVGAVRKRRRSGPRRRSAPRADPESGSGAASHV
jgi:hypothetical protein